MVAHSRLINNKRGTSYLSINIELFSDRIINQSTTAIPEILELINNNSHYSNYEYCRKPFDESKYWGVVVEDNHKQFIRTGNNSNSGTNQQELLIIDSETGNLLYSPQWDYNSLKSISIFPINNNKITIKNGNFKTLTNNKVYKSTNTKNNCINRNIKVNYSGNFLIKDISHSLDEEAHAGRGVEAGGRA